MLRLDGITKTFGGLTALEDVSFSVAGESITGIIGPNGAGKTTLFNIVSGLYTQTAGRVYLGEKNISFFAPETLASFGLVRTFQNVELFSQMTVLENAMVGLHTRSKSGIFPARSKHLDKSGKKSRSRKRLLRGWNLRVLRT